MTYSKFLILIRELIMKRICLILFFIELILFNSLNAQWERCNGPYGGVVNSIIANEDVVIASSTLGVFKSKNNGKSWTVIDSLKCWGFAKNRNIVYAGSSDGGILISTDNGENWSATDSVLPSLSKRIIIIKDTIIFVGTSKGIFSTSNNGESWSEMNNGLTNLDVYSLAIYGSNILAGTASGCIFQSSNNGENWTVLMQDDNVRYVYSLSVKDSNIYAGTYRGLLYSTNNGGSWTKVEKGPIGPISSIVIKDTLIFCSMPGSGICRSSDNGKNWTEINSGLTNDCVLSLEISGNNIFAGTSGNGVFISSNNGDSWEQISNGMSGITVNCCVADHTNIFVGTNAGGIFLSTDKGESWIGKNSGFHFSWDFNIQCITIKDSFLFAGDNYSIYRSSNYGENWQNLSSDYYNIRANKIIFEDTNMFASTPGKGIFFSSDMGDSWTSKNNNLQNLDIRAMLIEGDTIYAASYGFGILISTNYGESWETSNNGLTLMHILSLARCGERLLAGSWRGVMFYSIDNGKNWEILSLVFNNADINHIEVIGSNIFAGTSLGLYLSKDCGDTWTKVNPPLDSKSIYSLLLNGEYIYAGSSGKVGFFRAKLSDFGISDVQEQVVQSYKISIFPNPATNEITLSLPENKSIKSISIFNSLGMEVKRIEQTEIIRNSKITISVADLPVGLYHCSFVSQSGRVMKSFVVVK